MERLWGDFVPVPAERVRVLKGGEHVAAGGRELRRRLHARTRVAPRLVISMRRAGLHSLGDTAGIRRASGDYIMPPTPPPDIDLDAWRVSEDRILSWDPDTLFLTHFGPFHGARLHFQEMTARLQAWSDIVRRLLRDPSLDEDGRERAFIQEALLDLRRKVGEQQAEQYSRAGRIDYSWQGLSRYWRKREG